MPDPTFTPLVVPRIGETPTDVRGEAERARIRGHAAGFAEGRRLALEEQHAQRLLDQERMHAHEESYRRDAATALRALHSCADELHAKTEAVARMAVDEIERLAIELSEAILGAELSDPARSAAHALRRALDEIPLDRWVRVSVNKRDLALLTATEMSGLDGVEALASEHVDPGGAIVEIPHGAVDTRISLSLQRARAARAGVADDGALAG